MDYILRGNDKDVTNVLKEQRIRINRGMIQLIPISECGLVPIQKICKRKMPRR